MNTEKTLILKTGRSVKIIVDNANLQDLYKMGLEVLIKEPWESTYHPPIGNSHPKYWKLQRMDKEKSHKLQIAYSGLSNKDIRKAVTDLKLKLSTDPV